MSIKKYDILIKKVVYILIADLFYGLLLSPKLGRLSFSFSAFIQFTCKTGNTRTFDLNVGENLEARHIFLQW